MYNFVYIFAENLYEYFSLSLLFLKYIVQFMFINIQNETYNNKKKDINNIVMFAFYYGFVQAFFKKLE